MKKLTTTLLLGFIFICTASAQQIEKIFDKYMDDERFQYIYDGANMDKVNEKGLKNNGQKMLMLNVADAGLMKTFSGEVQEAVKAEGYKITTYVRHSTNKIQGYTKETTGRKDEVKFIQNGNENVMFIWESFTK